MLCVCGTIHTWGMRDASAKWTMYHMSCNSFEHEGVTVFIKEPCAYNTVDVFNAHKLVVTCKG